MGPVVSWPALLRPWNFVGKPRVNSRVNSRRLLLDCTSSTRKIKGGLRFELYIVQVEFKIFAFLDSAVQLSCVTMLRPCLP